jgi:hypothetical protein
MKKALEEAKKKNPDATFASDGVHPNSQGHWIICRNMLTYFGLKKPKMQKFGQNYTPIAR